MIQPILDRAKRGSSVLLLAATAVFFSLTACQNEDCTPENETSAAETLSSTETRLSEFAEILSRATYERQDLREFLKDEAVKQFDKNYDVLYALAKDKEIGGSTFRDILVEYSSEAAIRDIEENVPLLNILVPKIAIFGIDPADMDCTDPEIPVAVSKDKVTSLYLDGICVTDLEKGEIPDFHTFVVNENSRVIVDAVTRSGSPTVSFISPNYDGSAQHDEAPQTRSAVMSANEVGARAIAAYNYFYADDSGNHSRAYQRDYIYYGITPENNDGTLNRLVSEYISFIEIDPSCYYNISDQKTNQGDDDPYIKKYQTTKKKRPYTDEELIGKMWTSGSYNFRIEIFSSNSSQPIIVYLPLRPEEIWNFNTTYTREHKTWFSHSKYTHTIDPKKFTAKRVYLKDKQISFGKWDLSEEALHRYISIFEEDKRVKKTITVTHQMTKMTGVKVSGNIKFGLGDKDKISGGISGEISHSTTKTESQEYKFEREEDDDNLGSIRIYFFDPIIDGKSGDDYLVHTYNTGVVTFGLAVE